MSGRSPSAGVASLRARFEENAQKESPPSRGRSPAGSVASDSSRPISKVRTSFISVEPSGKMGDLLGLKETETLGTKVAGSDTGLPGADASTDKGPGGQEKSSTVMASSVNPDKPTSIAEDTSASLLPSDPKAAGAVSGGDALAGDAPGLGMILKGSPFQAARAEAKMATASAKLGGASAATQPTKKPTEPVKPLPGASTAQVKPKETTAALPKPPTATASAPVAPAKALQETTQAPKPASVPAEVTQEAPKAAPTAPLPAKAKIEAPKAATPTPPPVKAAQDPSKPITSTTASAKPAKEPSQAPAPASAPAPAPVSVPAKVEAPAPKPENKEAPAKSITTPVSTSDAKPLKPAVVSQPPRESATTTTKDVLPAVSAPSKSASGASPPVASKTSAEKPITETSKPEITAKEPGATSTSTKPAKAAVKKSGPTSPTIPTKPRPKSPTKPVKLPSHLTAPTAASAAKLDNAPPAPVKASRSPSRTSTVSSGKPAPKAVSTLSQQRRPPRASLPATGVTKQAEKPKPRQSLAGGTKPSNETSSFLERMMRPTASSAQKTHEKVDLSSKSSPPSKTSASKASTSTVAASRGILDDKRRGRAAEKAPAQKASALGSNSTSDITPPQPADNAKENKVEATTSNLPLSSSTLVDAPAIPSAEKPLVPQPVTDTHETF